MTDGSPKPKKPDAEIAKVLLNLASGMPFRTIRDGVPGWSAAQISKARNWFLSINADSARSYISGSDGKDEILQWRNAQERILTDRQRIRRLTHAHLEEGLDECRWCFAVDLKRVVGKEVARYDFPDATVWRFSCPRCGGEFSLYSAGYTELYLRDRIGKLHPELRGIVSNELLERANARVLYDFNLEDYED